MVELIITEKPTTEKKIAEALADGKPIIETHNGVKYYKITHNKKDILVGSAVGHLYGLAEVTKSSKIPNFDIEWKVLADIDKKAAFSKKYYTTLKKIAKEADTFTVATDYDIEGEVIGWNIVRFICKQKNAKRMKFSALTRKDLRESYKNASPELNWGNAIAGETRHIMDWYWGVNLSKAMTNAIKKGGMFKIMSIGRVQGPALNIVVSREKEIKKFIPTPFWVVELDTEFEKAKLKFSYKVDKILEEVKAKNIVKTCNGKDGKIEKVDRREKKYPAPNPFDLTSLQIEAYGLFGIQPKRTLEFAQELYTAGFISYPRTSSQQLPAHLDFKKILSDLGENKKYSKIIKEVLKTPLKPNNGKKTDPAHPAIYPTGVLPSFSEPNSEKIYDLIAKRFFATFGEDAKRDHVTISLNVEGETFTCKGSVTTYKGWHDLYDPYVKATEEILPDFKGNEVLKKVKVTSIEKETQPPKRYTPASIIKELEKKNLGTKATRAQIIEILSNRGYVTGKSLEATELGMKTVKILEDHCPEIIDEELTRQFEEELSKIENKKIKEETVLENVRKILTKVIKEFTSKEEQIGKQLYEANKETRDKESHIGKCVKCENGELKIKRGKFGMFIACSSYPDCNATFSLPSGALIKGTDKVCDECEHPKVLAIRRGKKPQDICINLDCPLKKIDNSKENEPCDKCKTGKFVVRKSIYGNFIACNNFPKCKNLVYSKKK